MSKKTNNQKSVEHENIFLEYLSYLKNPEFLKNFYGINISQKDVKPLEDFRKAIELKSRGYNLIEVSKMIGRSKSTIEKWVYNKNLPASVRVLQYYINLGDPKNNKWLSVNSTRGGLFTGPWILVPNKINEYEDVLFVLNQLRPVENVHELAGQFKLSFSELEKIKPNLFAYLLGMLVGDASKCGVKRKYGITRRISLSLTKAHQTNIRLGNFTSLCVNCLGLRMGRIKDTPKGKKNKNDFYRWDSQSSLLIQWVFNVCLGLDNEQRTTYDSIKIDWMLAAPDDFKTWFLQGLADSDGFVDLQAFQVGVITQPNTVFVKDLLNSLDVRSRGRIFNKILEGLMISLEDAYNLPIFNPIVRSYRFELLENLIKADRIKTHWPEWLNKEVDRCLEEGLCGTKVIKKILEEHNVAIRAKYIYQRVDRRLIPNE